MSWLMSILGIVVIGTIIDIFLNEKKLGKTVRSVIASLVVLVIISPLPVIFSDLKGCGNVFDNSSTQLNEGFLEYANAQKVAALEQGVESAYSQKGYQNVRVKIDAKIDTSINISMVSINISDVVIDNPALNINKVERIVSLCVEFLGVDKSIIRVIE